MVAVFSLPPRLLGPYGLLAVLAVAVYWNATPLLTRAVLCVMCNIYMIDVYLCVTAAMRLLLWATSDDDGRGGSAAVLLRYMLRPLDESECGALLLDTTLLTMCAGAEVKNWMSAMAARVGLLVCVHTLDACLQTWDTCARRRRIGVVVVALVGLVSCALQWSYYATLPPHAYHGSVAEQVLWYISVVHAVALGARFLGILCTAALHALVYPALACVGKWWRGSAHWLDDTALDPLSEDYMLYLRCAHALVLFAAAWSYLPPVTPPLTMQVMTLSHMYVLLTAGDKLRQRRTLLQAFASVAPSPLLRCGICLDDFRAGDAAKRLPCGHVFHSRCIGRWLMRSYTCPTCRRAAYEPLCISVVLSTTLQTGIRGVAADAVAPARNSNNNNNDDNNDDSDGDAHSNNDDVDDNDDGSAAYSHRRRYARGRSANVASDGVRATEAAARHVADTSAAAHARVRRTCSSDSDDDDDDKANDASASAMPLFAAYAAQLRSVEVQLRDTRARRTAALQQLHRLLAHTHARPHARDDDDDDTTYMRVAAASPSSSPAGSADLFTDAPLLAHSSRTPSCRDDDNDNDDDDNGTAAAAASAEARRTCAATHKRPRGDTCNVDDDDNDDSDNDAHMAAQHARQRSRHDDNNSDNDAI